MRKLIATAHMHPEQSGGVKLGRKSNDKRNHTADRGKAKVPMVNESESSYTKRRYLRPVKCGWYTGTREGESRSCWNFQWAEQFSCARSTSPPLRRKEGTCRNRMLTGLNRTTPMESRQRVTNPQGAVNSPAGAGSPKKRRPTCNGSDRAIPKAKACRRGAGRSSIERCKER